MFVDAWSEYQMLQDLGLFLPGPLDLQSLPTITALLESPSDDILTQSMLIDTIRDSIPSIDIWRKDHLQTLLLKSRHHLPGGHSDDILPLAICIFSCGDPTSLHTKDTHHLPRYKPAMWYPEYFYHPCNRLVKRCSDGAEDDFYLTKTTEYPGYSRSRLSLDNLYFNIDASNAAREIMDACHIDYRTTTAKNLDILGIRIFCYACRNKSQSIETARAMSWRRAVRPFFLAFHVINRYSRSSTGWRSTGLSTS